ncbi:transcriptional regulator, ArsR family [mine drainage metagenome]|uniref:Transcriptional regulator, ArsR family n=1 Tax=mine drainage metagenome TaxID=410659 RepID=T1B2M3_9ZZZZ
MDNRAFKDQIYEQLGRLGKSLASPKRLEMLDVLCQGPRTVESLAMATSQTLANASQHLKVLRTARLVEAEKQGLHVTYRLAGTEVCDFFLAFRHLAESRLAEIERTTRLFLDGKNVLEAVDQATLLKRVRSGEALVLDVRPEQEYRNGHIPRRAVGAAGRAGAAARRIAARPAGGGLLPRSVLRHGGRGGGDPAPPRPQGRAARNRRTRLAGAGVAAGIATVNSISSTQGRLP